MHAMPAIQVRNVPAELHQRLRARARAERMSLSEYVLDVLLRDLAIPSPREWAERLASREPVEADVIAAIEQARDQRDAELAAATRRR